MKDAQILADHLNALPNDVWGALHSILNSDSPIRREDTLLLANWINDIPPEVNAAIQRNKTQGTM